MPQISLTHKPSAKLSYNLSSVHTTSTDDKPKLIVFLNNLLAPAASWSTPIALLNQLTKQTSNSNITQNIPILTYDRFGQGNTTDRDPLDSRPDAEPGYGHDFADVVHDLRALITELIPVIFSDSFALPEINDIHLLLIGASIGAPLARLYAQTYPHTVAGMILLDSNIANAEYSSFWPDIDSPDFDPSLVVESDCTLEQFIEQSQKLSSIFGLAVKNAENLDRRNIPQLLPYADRPLLYGPGTSGEGQLTKVLVVGHDPVRFAEEGLERMQTPLSFTRKWTQPAWDRYNQGLLKIGDTSDFENIVRIANGCGHFIQRDNPQFVAQAVRDMMVALD